MNIPEIQEWRKQTEAKREAESKLVDLTSGAEQRLAQESAGQDDFWHFYNASNFDFLNLCVANAKASHLMVRNLLAAPDSDIIRPVDYSGARPTFNVLTRSIKTPDIGEFEVSAKFWYADSVESDDAVLDIAAVHPFQPDSLKETILNGSVMGKLTYDNFKRFDYDELAPLPIYRETIAMVCQQAGVEVIPVEFSPVYVTPLNR